MEWTKHFQTPLHIMPYHWTDSGGQQVEHLLEYGSEAQFGGTCTFTQPTHQSEMLAVTTDMSTFILVICYSPHWCFIQKVSYHSGGVYDPTVIYQEAEAGVSKLQARRLRSQRPQSQTAFQHLRVATCYFFDEGQSLVATKKKRITCIFFNMCQGHKETLTVGEGARTHKRSRHTRGRAAWLIQSCVCVSWHFLF